MGAGCSGREALALRLRLLLLVATAYVLVFTLLNLPDAPAPGSGEFAAQTSVVEQRVRQARRLSVVTEEEITSLAANLQLRNSFASVDTLPF